MAESPMTMMMHGMMAGGVMYLVTGSEYNAVLTANVVSTYMIMFGHALPM
ncbi:MAG: hypothetical protein L7T80_09235 [Arenicellales bacterium]|nr:hypothetical protein [Arenicellales bacterium]